MHVLQISFSELVLGLLSSGQYNGDPVVLSFMSQIDEIIQIITRYSDIGKKKVQGLVNKMAIETYTSEVVRLATQAGRLRFNISHANIKQLEEFSIRDLAHIIKEGTPCLWEMLDTALSPCSTETPGMAESDDMNEPDMYWNALEGCKRASDAVPGQIASNCDNCEWRSRYQPNFN